MEQITRPITTAEVAEAFGVDRRTILNWIKGGRLVPLFRAGASAKAGYLFDPDEVETLLAAQETP